MQSPMMRTPTNYLISAAAGFHYCKILSPFRALEWIYVDSQLPNKKTMEEEHIQILQWYVDTVTIDINGSRDD